MTNEEPSDITGIWDGGEDDGFYRQIARAAGMLMVRLTLSSKAYNRFADPHLLAPQLLLTQATNIPDTRRPGPGCHASST